MRVCWRELLGLVGCLLFLFPASLHGEVSRLRPGADETRDLAAGESHAYLLELDRGRYVYLLALQQRVDVRLVLRDPSGREVQRVDDQFLRGRHPENLVWISERVGEHRLEVEGVEGQGQYRLVWDSQWDVDATVDLRRRTPADRLYYRALGLQQRPEHRHCREAVELLEETLGIWAVVGDLAQEASALHNIGYCLNRLDDYGAASEFFERAIQRMPEGFEVQRAQSLQNLALAHRRLGRFGEAVAGYREAISTFHGLGRQLDEGRSLLGLGSALREQGELENALEFFKKARDLFVEVDSAQNLASSLNSIATTLTHLGRVDEALAFLEEARDLADPEDRLGARVRAAVEANTGSVYEWVGEPALALEFFERSIEQNEILGDRLGEARARRQLGVLYRDLGELDAALGELGRAAGLQGAIGRVHDLAQVRTLVADVYRRQGELEVALEVIELALPVLLEQGNVAEQAEALEKKGLILEALERFDEAGAVYEQGLRLLDRLQEPGRSARLRAAVGENDRLRGSRRRAEENLKQALESSRASRDHETEVRALVGLARLQGRRGDLEEATRLVNEALDVIERVRVRVGGETFRIQYMASQLEAYALGVDLLARRHRADGDQGYDQRAFELSEKMRARAFQDLVVAPREVRRRGAPEELVRLERDLRRRLNAREHFLLSNGRLPDEQRRQIAREIGGILRQLRDTEAKIFRESPALSQPRTETVSLTALQRSLDGETVFLEFLLGEERSYLWAITREEFRLVELPPGDELERLATEARHWLTLPGQQPRQQTLADRQEWAEQVASSEGRYVEVAERLSRTLFEPVEDLLPGRHLVIVLDGALQLLPFGALPVPGSTADSWEPLMARHPVLRAPSASAVEALRKRREGRPVPDRLLAVFGDPVLELLDDDLGELPRTAMGRGPNMDDLAPLPHAREEAQTLLRLARGRGGTLEALGFEATRERVLGAELDRYRYLVFATHALLDDRWPELSGIVLSTVNETGEAQNGFLALHDLDELPLTADLVVLSACETALGKSVGGEGLLSLSRGFLQSGAARVLASLWSVDDQGTAQLMAAFHRGLLADGLDSAEALRQAVASYRQDPQSERRRHPYYWAAFVTLGIW